MQKERDYSREVKMKHAELKARMYSIRTQKMKLDRTVVEMRSTIDSLKEELKTMEAALEEKQNETKMLMRVSGDQNNDNPRVMELVESLKRKEAEIEALKHRFDYKVWSVSTDDPSNPPANLTVSKWTKNKEVQETRPGNGTTTQVEDQIGNGEGETEMMAKQLDNSQEVNIKHGGGNATGEVQGNKSRGFEDVDHKGIHGEEIKMRGKGNFGNTENSELVEGQKLHVKTERGMKLEMQNKSSENKEGSRVRGKQDYITGIKGKKWRLVTRNRRMEKNGVARMRGRRFFGAEEAASNRRLTGDGRVMEAESGDAEDLENKLTHVDSSDAYGIASNDTKQKQQVEKSQGHEAISIQQNLSNKDISKLEDNADDDAQNFLGDLEVADAEEHEDDATEDGFLGESGSNLEDKEEYKEEIDESEF